MRVFEADYFAQAYPEILRAIISEGIRSSPRKMPIRELLGAAIVLKSTKRKFISNSSRDMNPVFPIVEIMWYLSGSDSPEIVGHYARNMLRYVNPFTGRFDGAYGARWRFWRGSFDQISHLLQRLRIDPDSRRAVIVTFDPLLDYREESLDVPCNMAFQFLLRDGKLNLITFCRSQDAWYGLANDVIEWQLLLDIIAGWLEVESGSLIHFIGSLHLYEDDLAKAQKVIKESNDDMYFGNIISFDPKATRADFNEIAKTFYEVERKTRNGRFDFSFDGVNKISNEFWRHACLAIIAYNARKYKKYDVAQAAMIQMNQQSDQYIILANWFKRRGEEIFHR